jgi:hypothetical protein
MNELEIISLDSENRSAVVRWFPKEALDATGEPTWWVGPYNYEIPTDSTGAIFSPEDLLTYLMTLCPNDLIEQIKRRRQIPPAKFNSDHLNLIGKRVSVKDQSAIVFTEPNLSIIPIASSENKPIVPQSAMTFGYNDIPWSNSYSADDTFYMDMQPIKRKIGQFREEAIIAAKEIQNHFSGRKLHVLFSGGPDSQTAVEAFYKAGIKPKLLCVRYTRDENADEIANALSYIKRNGITDYEIIDFDAFAWSKTEDSRKVAAELQASYFCSIAVFKPILERFSEEIVVICQGEPSLRKISGVWMLEEHEFVYSWMRPFMQGKLQGVPSFYFWSSELYTSYLSSTFWQKMINDEYENIVDYDQIKGLFYKEQFGLPVLKKIRVADRMKYWKEYNSLWTRRYVVPVKPFIAKMKG